jgi:hypothetical protein
MSKRRGIAEILLDIKEKGAEKLTAMNKSFDAVVTKASAAGLAVAGFSAVVGKLALDASVVENLRKSFKNLAESQGQDADKMLRNIKKLTAGTVSEADILKQANNALLLGLPIDKFGEMVNIARGASRATGESMEFMLQSITTGLGRQSKLILDNLGIVFNLEDAYEEYAKTIGRTADQLSDAEKKQAFINAAISRGTENLEKMGGIQPTVTDQWSKFKAQLKDGATELGSNTIPLLEIFIDTVLDVGESFSSILRTNASNDFFESISIAAVTAKSYLIDLIDTVIQLPALIKKHAKQLFTFDPKEREKLHREWEDTVTGIAKQKEEQRQKQLAKINARFRKKERDLYGDSEKQKNDKAVKLAKIREELKIQNEKKDLEQLVNERSEKTKQANKKEEAEYIDMWQGKAEAADRSLDIIIEQQDKAEEEQRKRRKKRAEKEFEEEKQRQKKLSDFTRNIAATLTRGREGASQAVVESLSFGIDAAFPGAGQFAKPFLEMFAQGPEHTRQQIELFAEALPLIIENIAESVPVFIDALVDNADDIITAIIQASPRFTEALAIEVPKALALSIKENAPQIWKAFMEGFWFELENFKVGWKKLSGELANSVFADISTGVHKGFQGLEKALIDLSDNAFGDLVDKIKDVTSRFENIDAGLATFFNDLADTTGKAFEHGLRRIFSDDLYVGIRDAIVKAFKDAFSIDINVGGGGNIIDQIGNALSGVFGGYHGGVIPGYNLGGPIDGTIVRATPGEFMVNRDSTQANLGLLNQINNSRGRPVSTGGGININVYGGLMGDKDSAREFALAIDRELVRLRQGNESQAFDFGIV